jgi:preprotein translocase subunit SecG
MTTTLMIFQAAVSVLLIVLVLLQFGKGAEAGLLCGGGESIMTGAQQGNILSKATVILSILFMGNSVLLSKIQSEKATSSLLDTEAPVARPLNSDAIDTTNALPATKEAPKADAKMEDKAATEKKEK